MEDDMVDVEAFILDNEIDEKAAIALRELDFEMQQDVLSRGMLSDARNPSAVLLSRIRQCRQRGGREKSAVGGRSARENLNQEVEEFVRANNLDERAQNCLAESDASVIRQLLATPLTDARNPSAVVLSRMRQIKQDSASGRGPRDSFRGGGQGRNESSGGGRGGGRGGLERQIKEFIRANDLDERASNCIRESSEEVVQMLLERGPLSHARNASAMALSRIRSIQEDLKAGLGRSNERPSRPSPPAREMKEIKGKETSDDWGKGKGKGKGDDDYSWMWYMPPWAWGWGPWSKGGGWDDWGKGDGKGKGGWGADEGKGGDSKSRAKPY